MIQIDNNSQMAWSSGVSYWQITGKISAKHGMAHVDLELDT
jgi:hypothetical protein